MVLACLFRQKNKLMLPFAQSQEKGEEGAADEEPGR